MTHKLQAMMAVLLGALISTPLAAAETVQLGRFNAGAGIPKPWQAVPVSKKLKPTQYRIASRDGITGIEAVADSSMSLLARPLAVNLAATPVLCWRWRVDAPLQKADMARKSGDDYAARVYVALAIPPANMSFATRAKLRLARSIFGDAVPDAALNYVWDNRYPVGSTKPNAYTELTRMIVVESGPARAGRWVEARRDLAGDITRHFPDVQAQPVLLAVASDTDNTGEQARAGFADFHLVAKGSACDFTAAP